MNSVEYFYKLVHRINRTYGCFLQWKYINKSLSIPEVGEKEVKRTLNQMQRAMNVPINSIMAELYGKNPQKEIERILSPGKKGETSNERREKYQEDQMSKIRAQYANAASVAGLGPEAGAAAFAENLETMSVKAGKDTAEGKKYEALAKQELDTKKSMEEATMKTAKIEDAYRKISQAETSGKYSDQGKFVQEMRKMEDLKITNEQQKISFTDKSGIKQKKSYNRLTEEEIQMPEVSEAISKAQESTDFLSMTRGAVADLKDPSQLTYVSISSIGSKALEEIKNALKIGIPNASKE